MGFYHSINDLKLTRLILLMNLQIQLTMAFLTKLTSETYTLNTDTTLSRRLAYHLLDKVLYKIT